MLSPASSAPSRLPLIAAFAITLAIGAASRRFLMANTDISGLIAFAEKMRGGSRLYVDIIEPSPPMSIYFHLPAAALGRLTGIESERMLSILIFTLALVSAIWAGRQIPRVMVIAAEPAVSFPTTRAVGGIWADQAFTGRVVTYANDDASSPAVDERELPALRELLDKRRRFLAADIAGRHPDVILIQRKPFDFLEWSRRDPEISALLECFHTVGRASEDFEAELRAAGAAAGTQDKRAPLDRRNVEG